MVDFRFHLISIVAVFLALGLGILAGSGFIGDALIKDIDRRVDSISRQNNELRAQIDELDAQIDADRRFMEEVVPAMVGTELRARPVVLFRVEGIDDGVIDGVERTIEDAGGEIVTTILLTDRFSLPGQAERDQLALIAGSLADEPAEILAETGRQLAAGSATSSDPQKDGAEARFDGFLENLADADFVDVRSAREETIPNSALFLILGGDDEEPAYDASALVLPLARSLGEASVPVLVGEPGYSRWGLVDAIRGDAAAAVSVATVDQVDQIPGWIAVALGLRIEQQDPDGPADHYGTRGGSTRVVPALPTP